MPSEQDYETDPANMTHACEIDTADGGLPEELSLEEGKALLDRAARKYLTMSGEEFVEAWDVGLFGDRTDTFPVMSVAALLPLVR